MAKGFLEEIIETAMENRALYDIAERSRGADGKVDRFKASAMAANYGLNSWDNIATLTDKMDLIDRQSSGSSYRYSSSHSSTSNYSEPAEEEPQPEEPAYVCEEEEEETPPDPETVKWRKKKKYAHCPCDFDPEYFDDEKEYLEAVELESQRWLKECPNDYGIKPADFTYIEDYIDAVNEKEAMYGWRKTVKRHPKVNPKEYETLCEYQYAVEMKNKKWRDKYMNTPGYHSDPDDFDSEVEYLQAEIVELRKSATKAEKLADIHIKRANDAQDVINKLYKEMSAQETNDKTVYRLCGVAFNPGGKIYKYRCDDESINIGDKVIVNTPKGEEEVNVLSIEYHTAASLPFNPKHAQKVRLKCKAKKFFGL